MKKLLLISTILFTGCAQISVNKTVEHLDTNGKVAKRETLRGGGVFFLAKGEASQISIGKETKTTSQLFGADKLEESGDTEMMNALTSFIGAAAVKAFTQGVK